MLAWSKTLDAKNHLNYTHLDNKSMCTGKFLRDTHDHLSNSIYILPTPPLPVQNLENRQLLRNCCILGTSKPNKKEIFYNQMRSNQFK